MAAGDTTVVKTFTKEEAKSADLNAEFSNIYTNMQNKSGAQTISGRKTFSGGIILDELVAIDAAGAGDVKLTEFRWDPASGTVTDADGMYIPWMSDDDAGNDTEYGRQHLEFVDTGAASEDSSWVFSTITAASLTTALTMSSATAAFAGIVTATTVEPTGDTAAGDNAAMGYTAAEGLILTGQGTTSDVTLKNDADANVLNIPTGKTWVGINETANANMTIGLTINQGASDDEAFALKSSDVAHGMTDRAETDTYLTISKAEAAAGGGAILGLKDADGSGQNALFLRGMLGEAASTTKATNGYGVVTIEASIKSGTTNADVGSDGNLVSISNRNTVRFIFDAEGSGHAEVAWTTYDSHNDHALVRTMEDTLLAMEGPGQTDRRRAMEATGIIGKDSWHMENGKPRAMVNFTKLAMLHHGALIQAGDERQELRAMLDERDSRILALEQQMKQLKETN